MFTSIGSGAISIWINAIAAVYDVFFPGTMNLDMCDRLSRSGAVFVPIALFNLYSFLIQRVYAVIPNRKPPKSAVWLSRMRYSFLLMVIPTGFFTTGRLLVLDLGSRGIFLSCVVSAHPVLVGVFAFLDLCMAFAYFTKFYSMIRALSSPELSKSLTSVNDMEDVAARNFRTSTALISVSLVIDIMALSMHYFPEETKMIWFIGAAPLFLVMGIAMVSSNPNAWQRRLSKEEEQLKEDQALARMSPKVSRVSKSSVMESTRKITLKQ
eukprot:TRINITY_DN24888_c0_g1_i1.p2 TRINITY_DN24888_c0_g1~~TRINITY_DN24888_c0_g1_i1.p2  ORF type:complete len:267 (+),score=56.94 TRINITY_DN24888_c0_g1_i1:1-801(+)